MRLRSNLGILLELDLSSLLAVQGDVTHLIEMKVDELQMGASKHQLSSKYTNDGIDNKENFDDSKSMVRESDNCDSDDYILTQFDQRVREKLLKSSTTEMDAEETEYQKTTRKSDLSSPLKESNSLANFTEELKDEDLRVIGETRIRESDLKIKKDREPSSLNITKMNNGTSDAKINPSTNEQIRSNASRKVLVKSVDFNTHPVRKRPWILEDFKRNQDHESIIRGRSKMRVAKLYRFYARGGMPPTTNGIANQNEVRDGQLLHSQDDSLKFDNLRERSQSPPGYGRLDFPTTQERFDDKQKSQDIIFRKTRERFIAATCVAVPPQERAYLFKNDYLNNLVDDGTIEWHAEELKIFTRK